MVKFNIITLFTNLFELYLNFSVFKKNREKGIFDYKLIDLREFGLGKHRKVDDYPYGGGKGMVLMPEPLSKAIESIDERGIVIYFSPKGLKLDNNFVKKIIFDYDKFLEEKNLKNNNLNDTNNIKKNNVNNINYKIFTLICGRYEGIDQRIIDLYVDIEISLGDFVLTSGEIPALAFIDSLCRFLEGFLEKEAISEESFENFLLEYPHYTRPKVFKNLKVPDVLVSGDHKKIEDWRFIERLKITKKNRKDLYYKFLEENNE